MIARLIIQATIVMCAVSCIIALSSCADAQKKFTIINDRSTGNSTDGQTHNQLTGDSAVETKRPNIVVIMVDDLDSMSLETLLSGGYMPHFSENFVSSGIEFENYFVSARHWPAHGHERHRSCHSAIG